MESRLGPKRLLLGALPFAGAALILALLFRRVPPERILDALSGADLLLFLAALLPVSVLYVLLDGALLSVVLRWFHPPGIGFRESLAVRAVDYLVSLWNGRASQAAMVGTLGRRFGTAGRQPESHPDSGYWECAGTILFLDLCQRAHLLFWAAGGAIALGSEAPDHVPAAAALGFAGLCLLVAFLRGRLNSLWWNPGERRERRGARLTRRVREEYRVYFDRNATPSAAKRRGSGGMHRRSNAAWVSPQAVKSAGLGPPRWKLLHTLRHAAPGHYLWVLAFKAPLIVAAAVGHHFALGAFGIQIPVGSLLATLPIIFLAGALPIAVARIGTSQAAWLYFHAGAAAASPGGEAALLAYSLSAHLTFLLLNAALSAPFLPTAWRTIRGASRTGSPDEGPPSGTPEEPVRGSVGTRSGTAADPLSVAS